MQKLFVLAACLLAVSFATPDNHWVVLVAGSKGYGNYRHQADVCHAYQIARGQGIPESQIITFAYDDIANSASNPFPGKVFNQPNGKDVYASCKIDYRGSDVNPKKFLQVIKGEGSGKVLKSTSADKVFMYFADHGAPGLIAFPSGHLYADDLNSALKEMHSKNMYERLVFYIEACESGSMFENLLDSNINVYGVTAANAKESSWGYYCYPDDVVNGVHLRSCLGDEFSINFLEDSDNHAVCAESLHEQFSNVKAKTKKSHVMEYGDLSFKTGEAVGQYQGVCDSLEWSFFGHSREEKDRHDSFAVDSREANLHYLYADYLLTNDVSALTKLQDEIAMREEIELTFMSLAQKFPVSSEIIYPKTESEWNCYKEASIKYSETCEEHDHALDKFGQIMNMCTEGKDMWTKDDIKQAIIYACI